MGSRKQKREGFKIDCINKTPIMQIIVDDNILKTTKSVFFDILIIIINTYFTN